MRTPTTQKGAALIEFSVVAAVLLGIVLPGMIAVGKSLSELNAAAQGAYLAVQSGADVKVPFSGNEPDTNGYLTEQIAIVNTNVANTLHHRGTTTYPLMASNVQNFDFVPRPDPAQQYFFRTSEDPEHWMVQSEMIAYFPAILTNIPVHVKSVSSMLNVQPKATGDISLPQRLKKNGVPQGTNCKIETCSGGGCSTTIECCKGYMPEGATSGTTLFDGHSEWLCSGDSYGGTGNTGGDGGDGGGQE